MKNFHQEIKSIIHLYIQRVYRTTKNFPKDELFGVTSQLRRSSMSVMLNYIEGFARRKGEKSKIFLNFIETAYGSLKESEYLIYFSFTENYLNKDDHQILRKKADRIGGMLYGIINKHR